MRSKYAGMTVNERLYISGLTDQFDQALRLGNVDAIVRILLEVGITDKNSIKAIIDSLGLNVGRGEDKE